jgi:hypothetical protein
MEGLEDAYLAAIAEAGALALARVQKAVEKTAKSSKIKS